MNDIDGKRTTPPRPRWGDRAGVVATVTTLVAGLSLILVVACSPGADANASPDPTAETFAAIATDAVPSAKPTVPASTALSPAASSPSASPVSSPSPVADPNHVATRVRVPELGIDLAVVAPPKDRSAYPKCDVAMYLADLQQPGEDGATYLYAHARAGMFLPIYQRAIQRLHGGPRSMLGMQVEVYTSDDLRYLYTIKEVRVHQTSLHDAARAKTDELWLQTSEGPKGTRGKTQVRAVSAGLETATHRQAHPVAKPITCG
jgi:sortase (surface protein transpeptidase)